MCTRSSKMMKLIESQQHISRNEIVCTSKSRNNNSCMKRKSEDDILIIPETPEKQDNCAHQSLKGLVSFSKNSDSSAEIELITENNLDMKKLRIRNSLNNLSFENIVSSTPAPSKVRKRRSKYILDMCKNTKDSNGPVQHNLKQSYTNGNVNEQRISEKARRLGSFRIGDKRSSYNISTPPNTKKNSEKIDAETKKMRRKTNIINISMDITNSENQETDLTIIGKRSSPKENRYTLSMDLTNPVSKLSTESRNNIMVSDMNITVKNVVEDSNKNKDNYKSNPIIIALPKESVRNNRLESMEIEPLVYFDSSDDNEDNKKLTYSTRDAKSYKKKKTNLKILDNENTNEKCLNPSEKNLENEYSEIFKPDQQIINTSQAKHTSDRISGNGDGKCGIGDDIKLNSRDRRNFFDSNSSEDPPFIAYSNSISTKNIECENEVEETQVVNNLTNNVSQICELSNPLMKSKHIEKQFMQMNISNDDSSENSTEFNSDKNVSPKPGVTLCKRNLAKFHKFADIASSFGHRSGIENVNSDIDFTFLKNVSRKFELKFTQYPRSKISSIEKLQNNRLIWQARNFEVDDIDKQGCNVVENNADVIKELVSTKQNENPINKNLSEAGAGCDDDGKTPMDVFKHPTSISIVNKHNANDDEIKPPTTKVSARNYITRSRKTKVFSPAKQSKRILVVDNRKSKSKNETYLKSVNGSIQSSMCLRRIPTPYLYKEFDMESFGTQYSESGVRKSTRGPKPMRDYSQPDKPEIPIIYSTAQIVKLTNEYYKEIYKKKREKKLLEEKEKTLQEKSRRNAAGKP